MLEIVVGYNCVVLVKQVPDTKQITGQAMNDDGTVNRAALPAIFNPEDLNALEMALQIKEKYGGKVVVMSMGLPAAAEVLRQAMFRGADAAVLITDRRCAASDTLATSYILSCGVKKLNPDIILCGRQAIDGDTAQVGPQLAEKLGLPQVTYVEELLNLSKKTIEVKRNLGNGWQRIRGTLPVLLTVIDTANEPRISCAKRLMKYKTAACKTEIQAAIRTQNPAATGEEMEKLTQARCRQLADKAMLIEQWDLDFLKADLGWCGKDGSPTKVHRIQSVVLTAKESKTVEPNQAGVDAMVHELIADRTLG